MTEEEFPTLVLWSAFAAKSADGTVAFEVHGHPGYLIELIEVLRPTVERWGLQVVDVPPRPPSP